MSNKSWTPEMDAKLTELWAIREMYAIDIGFQIGAQFGRYISKNSVIGRAHRLHLPLRLIGPSTQARSVYQRQYRQKLTQTKRQKRIQARQEIAKMVKEGPPIVPAVPPIIGRDDAWKPLDS